MTYNKHVKGIQDASLVCHMYDDTHDINNLYIRYKIRTQNI